MNFFINDFNDSNYFMPKINFENFLLVVMSYYFKKDGKHCFVLNYFDYKYPLLNCDSFFINIKDL